MSKLQNAFFKSKQLIDSSILCSEKVVLESYSQ